MRPFPNVRDRQRATTSAERYRCFGQHSCWIDQRDRHVRLREDQREFSTRGNEDLGASRDQSKRRIDQQLGLSPAYESSLHVRDCLRDVSLAGLIRGNRPQPVPLELFLIQVGGDRPCCRQNAHRATGQSDLYGSGALFDHADKRNRDVRSNAWEKRVCRITWNGDEAGAGALESL